MTRQTGSVKPKCCENCIFDRGFCSLKRGLVRALEEGRATQRTVSCSNRIDLDRAKKELPASIIVE